MLDRGGRSRSIPRIGRNGRRVKFEQAHPGNTRFRPSSSSQSTSILSSPFLARRLTASDVSQGSRAATSMARNSRARYYRAAVLGHSCAATTCWTLRCGCCLRPATSTKSTCTREHFATYRKTLLTPCVADKLGKVQVDEPRLRGCLRLACDECTNAGCFSGIVAGISIVGLFGTTQTTANAAACPQLVGADIRGQRLRLWSDLEHTSLVVVR
jgi:hypothetical protein